MEFLLNYISSIDPSVRTLPDAVYTIWQTVLFIVIVVIVPLAIILLQRTLNAALKIRRYLREMLTAGVAIAENTSSISALEDTITVAGGMVKSAGQLDEHTATIATVLSERAKGQAS